MAKLENLKRKSNKSTNYGGARPGSGRKKGMHDKHTVEARKAAERFISRVARNADKLFDAQLTKALGTSHLFRKVKERNEDGKVIRTYIEEVTDKRTIEAYLEGEFVRGDSVNDSENYYYITTKAPDNAAIVAMLDRGLGKPTETIEADITSLGERITSVSESQFTQLARARAERRNI